MTQEPLDPEDDSSFDTVDLSGATQQPDGDATLSNPDLTRQDHEQSELESTTGRSDERRITPASTDSESTVDEGEVDSTRCTVNKPEGGDSPSNIDATIHTTDASAETENGNIGAEAAADQTFCLKADQTARDDHSPNGADQVAQRIGRYEVISILGEGAFGQVLKCRDPQLDRIVAVKIAKSNVMSDQSKVERFLREAKSAGLLRHPNIIPVFEYGTVDQVHYIAYQFIEGQTLKTWLKAHADQPLEECMEVFAKLADALGYAHDCGIVHRDIKPDNILIDSSNTPHIADFGCARMDGNDINQTVDGSLMGTPAYMSPEQASGRSREADGRSDLWSVGVMLYEQLCGKRPFEGKLTTLILKITTEEPVSPSRIRSGLPRDLVTLCMKCLAKEPTQRLQHCGELAAELRRWLHGEPILSRPVPPWVRTWMWAKRNPLVATLSGLFVVTLLIGTLVSSSFAIQANRRQAALVKSQLESLLAADSSSVPLILDNLKTLGGRVPATLQRMQSSRDLNQRQALRLQLAQTQFDKSSAEQRARKVSGLGEDLLQADPAELVMAVSLIVRDTDLLVAWLWTQASNAEQEPEQRLRAVAALAMLDPQSTQWETIDGDAVSQLMREPADTLGDWCQAFAPRAAAWRDELERLYTAAGDDTRRRQAALVLGHLFNGDVDYLVNLVDLGSAEQLRVLIPFLRPLQDELLVKIDGSFSASANPDVPPDFAVTRQVNRALLACALGETELLESIWLNVSDPSGRTEAIHRYGPAGLGPQPLRYWFARDSTTDARIVSAALETLVEASDRDLHTTARQSFVPLIAEIFQRNPDSGVHQAAAWVLRQWNQQPTLQQARLAVQSVAPRPGMNWHEDPQGMSWIVVGPVASFAMGNPDANLKGAMAAVSHRREIPRRWGISATEITVGEFRAFEESLMERARIELEGKDAEQDPAALEALQRSVKRLERTIANRQLGDDPSVPVTNVTWIEAAAYCNWLSEQAGLDPSVWAYPPEANSLSFDDHSPADANLQGFRLPTAAEWEYLCRAGSQTQYYVGRTPQWLSAYEWTVENSSESLHPVGQLKPNWLGGFDLHGNAAEWCDDWPIVLSEEPTETIVDGRAEKYLADDREIRGGSYRDEFGRISSYARDGDFPDAGYAWRGFRLARTYSGAK